VGRASLIFFHRRPDMPEKLQLFMNGIMASGYFMPFVKLTETLCGLLLLLGVAPRLGSCCFGSDYFKHFPGSRALNARAPKLDNAFDYSGTSSCCGQILLEHLSSII
jgi:hypothetical protein